jgi:hypothetical protein
MLHAALMSNGCAVTAAKYLRTTLSIESLYAMLQVYGTA